MLLRCRDYKLVKMIKFILQHKPLHTHRLSSSFQALLGNLTKVTGDSQRTIVGRLFYLDKTHV